MGRGFLDLAVLVDATVDSTCPWGLVQQELHDLFKGHGCWQHTFGVVPVVTERAMGPCLLVFVISQVERRMLMVVPIEEQVQSCRIVSLSL